MLDALARAALDSPLNQWIQATYWLWPILEIIHFVGLTLLLGGLLIIDLRIAGHFRRLNPLAIHGLLPLVLAGFSLNLVTGVLFFIGDPMRYSINIGFQVKMSLIFLAGVNALLYYWKVAPLVPRLAAGDGSPMLARLVAYASLALWAGVLLSGRLIPYVGTG